MVPASAAMTVGAGSRIFRGRAWAMGFASLNPSYEGIRLGRGLERRQERPATGMIRTQQTVGEAGQPEQAGSAAEGANARNRSGPITAVGSHSGETGRAPLHGPEPAPKGQEASGVHLPRPAL